MTFFAIFYAFLNSGKQSIKLVTMNESKETRWFGNEQFVDNEVAIFITEIRCQIYFKNKEIVLFFFKCEMFISIPKHVIGYNNDAAFKSQFVLVIYTMNRKI